MTAHTQRMEANAATVRSNVLIREPNPSRITPSAASIAETVRYLVRPRMAQQQGIRSPPMHSQQQSAHMRLEQQSQAEQKESEPARWSDSRFRTASPPLCHAPFCFAVFGIVGIHGAGAVKHLLRVHIEALFEQHATHEEIPLRARARASATP